MGVELRRARLGPFIGAARFATVAVVLVLLVALAVAALISVSRFPGAGGGADAGTITAVVTTGATPSITPGVTASTVGSAVAAPTTRGVEVAVEVADGVTVGCRPAPNGVAPAGFVAEVTSARPLEEEILVAVDLVAVDGERQTRVVTVAVAGTGATALVPDSYQGYPQCVVTAIERRGQLLHTGR